MTEQHGGPAADESQEVEDAQPQGLAPARGERELVIAELAASLAEWGVTENDDELLTPIAATIAALLTLAPGEGETEGEAEGETDRA
ncbi:MAG TPA: hypothetical protein VLC52_16675 [Anaerolineae bacterium]|nr:hypothetical protein [Anaerolineae bacterium]